MTLDDMLAREAIRETMARYTTAGDRLQEDAFIAVFTEDAILESEKVPASDLFRYVGRTEIRQWIARWRNASVEIARTHQASFVRHHLSTCHIELTGPDRAAARTYWVAYTDIGPDHAGYYIDAFRKIDASWLIAHRRIRRDWQSLQSLFTTAIANTR